MTNVGAFAVTTARPARRDLAAWRGLARSSPVLAGALLVRLLGLVGTPPTAVFVGKVTVAAGAWEAGAAWLALALAANTVLSLGYYLRWVVPVFQRDTGASGGQDGGGDGSGAVTARTASTAVAVGGAVLAVAVGIGAGLLWPALTGGLPG